MELIEFIEDQDYAIDKNTYLHAFNYEHNHFITMLNNGIKAPIFLGKTFNGNFNGSYYVSLMRHEECEHDVYKKLIGNPMFIINGNIKTIHAKNFVENTLYWRPIIESPLPFRCSPYDNEYQRFLKVSPKDIIGLNYNLFNDSALTIEQKIERLKILKAIIEDLQKEEKELQIVDYSSSKIINKEKVLTLI